MQFESMFVNFDSWRLTKEHPFSPEGSFNNYLLLESPQALHYHDFLEIGYCEKGSGLFYVDGDVIPFNGPCCTIIYGGQIHIAQGIFPTSNCSTDWNLWQFSYINLKSLFADTDLTQLNGLKAASPHMYDFPTVFSQAEQPILYDLIHAIIDETVYLHHDYLTAIRGLIITLLARHGRLMTPTTNPLKSNRDNREQILSRLGTVLVYINQHYTDDVTVEQLVEISCLSKSTLQREMLAFTGMAPMQYIHHLRMKRATLLLVSDQPVANVAFDVGYNTLSSFNRHFLQKFGVSPSQWKKQHQL